MNKNYIFQPFLHVSDERATKLRDLLIKTLQEEQREMIAKGAYNADITVMGRMKALAEKNPTPEDMKILTDVARLTYVRFCEILQAYASPFRVIEKGGSNGNNSGNGNTGHIIHKA